MEFQKFLKPAYKLIMKEQSANTIRNGLILLKGGNLDEELGIYANKAIVTDISKYFDEPYFETKKIIYFPV